jgi:hypothetical protein
MPKLLLAYQQKGWPHVERLLLALLRFLEPYLRNADLTDAVRMLYKVCGANFFLLPPFLRMWQPLSLASAQLSCCCWGDGLTSQHPGNSTF